MNFTIILRKTILALLLFSVAHKTKASDIELIEDSPDAYKRSDYLIIEMAPSDDEGSSMLNSDANAHLHALIPKDIWRWHILPNLKINSKLKLSYTCRFFHQIIHEIEPFKQEKKEFFERMFSDLIDESPKGLKLINYLSKLQCAMRVLQQNQVPYYLNRPRVKERFRTLRNIRQIPGVDSDFIDRRCLELGINEIERPQALFASRLTASYFKNRLIKDGLSIAYSIGCVVVSIEVLRRSLSFQADSVPWLSVSTPVTTFKEVFHHGLDEFNIYSVDTLNLIGWHVNASVASGTNNIVSKNYTLNELTPYTAKSSHDRLPLIFFTGWFWASSLATYGFTRLNQPIPNTDTLTLNQAQRYYNKSLGFMSNRKWLQPTWVGVKSLVILAIIYWIFNDTEQAYHFCKDSLTKAYYQDYIAAVENLIVDLQGPYLAVRDLNQTTLIDNANELITPGICSVFFSYEAFKELTPVFVEKGLMSMKENWQYVHQKLKYPELEDSCDKIFDVILNNRTMLANTTIRYIYPKLVTPVIKHASSLPTLFFTGIWFAGSIPTVLMTLQLIYLFFIAVW